MRNASIRILLAAMIVPLALAAVGVKAERVSLFDGKTLKGWNALDMSYWSVRNGAMTGESTDEHPCKKNQFLVWQGGTVDDFQLDIDFRLVGGFVLM